MANKNIKRCLSLDALTSEPPGKSIISHQRSANQNYSEILPHTHQDDCSLKKGRQSHAYTQRQKCEEIRIPVNVKRCSCCGKVWLLKRLNKELLYIQQFITPSHIPKEIKSQESKRCFQASVCFSITVAKRQKQPNYVSKDEWINKIL